MNLTNLHYLAVNANVDIERILSDVSVQKIAIRTLSIQFPDPQFKLRNRKRRVVNDQFVEVRLSHWSMLFVLPIIAASELATIYWGA